MKKLFFILLFLISQAHAAQTVFTDSTVAACVDPAPSNTGNGSCTTSNPTGFLQTEIFTFTATTGGPTATFTVSGSVSGSHTSITSGGTRAVKTSAGFTKFSINIADGGTAWVAGDNFTVATVSGTIFKKSNFDLLTLNQICSNGCDSSTILNLLTNTAVRFQDAAGGQYVGFVAPSVVNDSYSITLPSDAPTSNTFLKYDGANYVWGTETTNFPLLATDGSASAPSYSFTNNSNLGWYRSATNTMAAASAGIKSAQVDGSQQWSFGSSSSSARTHSFYKDVNAGDSTQPVILQIGNSGSNQGTSSLKFYNDSASNGSYLEILHEPRNTANTSTFSAARLQLVKESGTDAGAFVIAAHDGTSLKTIDRHYYRSGRPAISLNYASEKSAISEVGQAKTDQGLAIKGYIHSDASSIYLYGDTHATKANLVEIYSNGTASQTISQNNTKFTVGSGTEYGLFNGASTQSMNISADSNGASGGQIVLFGSSHGSTPNTIQINTANVGAISIDANQRAYGKAGASTSQTTAIGGVLNSQSTAVGNVGGGTDDLMTYTLPANVLNITNDSLHIVAGGTFAANANSKRLICLFGSSNMIDSTALVLNGGSWHLDAWVIRTGASAEKVIATLQSSNSLLVSTTTYSSLSESLTTTRTIKCTAAATSDNDITEELSLVEFKPAK